MRGQENSTVLLERIFELNWFEYLDYLVNATGKCEVLVNVWLTIIKVVIELVGVNYSISFESDNDAILNNSKADQF